MIERDWRDSGEWDWAAADLWGRAVAARRSAAGGPGVPPPGPGPKPPPGGGNNPRGGKDGGEGQQGGGGGFGNLGNSVFGWWRFYFQSVLKFEHKKTK